MASVTEAMMWLVSDGSMWRKMIRASAAAVEPRGGDEVLGAQRQEAAAHDARELGPADQRQDQGDGEVAGQPAASPAAVAALRPSQIGMVGSDSTNSMTRWMTKSIRPP